MDDIVTDEADIDCAAVQLRFLQKKIDVVTIYTRPGTPVRRQTWTKLIRKSETGNSRIIAGDFNAHHTIWNCESSDYYGEILLEEMENEDVRSIETRTAGWAISTREIPI